MEIFALLFLKKSYKDYIIIINIRSVRPSSLQVATGRSTAYLEVVGSVLFAAAAGTDSHPGTPRVMREIAELAGSLCLLRLSVALRLDLYVHFGSGGAVGGDFIIGFSQLLGNNSERWMDVGRSGHATRETPSSGRRRSTTPSSLTGRCGCRSRLEPTWRLPFLLSMRIQDRYEPWLSEP